jgi:hypothetical protein
VLGYLFLPEVREFITRHTVEGDDEGAGAGSWSLSLLTSVTALRSRAPNEPSFARLLKLHDVVEGVANGLQTNVTEEPGQRRKGHPKRQGNALQNFWLRLSMPISTRRNAMSLTHHRDGAGTCTCTCTCTCPCSHAHAHAQAHAHAPAGKSCWPAVSLKISQQSSERSIEFVVPGTRKRRTDGQPEWERSRRQSLNLHSGGAYAIDPAASGKIDTGPHGMHVAHDVPQSNVPQLSRSWRWART